MFVRCVELQKQKYMEYRIFTESEIKSLNVRSIAIPHFTTKNGISEAFICLRMQWNEHYPQNLWMEYSNANGEKKILKYILNEESNSNINQ